MTEGTNKPGWKRMGMRQNQSKGLEDQITLRFRTPRSVGAVPA